MKRFYKKFCVIMLSVMVSVTFCPAGVFAESSGGAELSAKSSAASAEQKNDAAAKKAEAQAKAEEAAKKAEAQAKAEEAAKKAEEQAKAEEAAKKAEEQKKAEEAAKKAEEQKKAEEAAKKAEEQAKAEEAAKKAEEQAKAEEAAKNAEAAASEEAEEAKPSEGSENAAESEAEAEGEAAAEAEAESEAESDAASAPDAGSGASEEKAAAQAMEAEEGDDSGSDTIGNGTYKPDAFTFTGGTGKTRFDCEKVIVKDGKYTAVFTTTSTAITHLYMGTPSSNDEDPSLYDPLTGKLGEKVTAFSNKKAIAENVSINEEKPFGARTTAMSEPHWVGYTYKITLTADSEKISDSTEVPDITVDDDPSGEEQQEQEEPAASEPEKKGELGVGTWKVSATTDRKMFYLYPKDTNPAKVILKVNKNGSMTATITLSGEGYDYVYMGTPAQAKKAGKKKWIKAKIVNGYYTFTIPVSKLDTKLTITPHSKKYEEDGDAKTEPWRPDKWIIFYSAGAKKVKDGTSTVPTKKKKSSSKKSGKTSGTQTKFKNDKKADKESKWKDDSGKSTSAVDNRTSLKDGVYTPDKFSWSGGSGRLAFIRCNKITVKGGQAYATIEFGSSQYDSLKANGRVYSKQGGGNSKFVIPVKLNANNTIIGRTTAMSQPHWVKYTIFIYKAGATGKSGAAGDDGHVTSTKKLSDEAPDLLGLKAEGENTVEYAELFRIFHYEKGICLISIDQSKNTALYKKDDGKKTESEEDAAQPVVEYDEDGKPIAKTDSERTNDLYQNNVVNYLILPKGAEIPAGLEKDCVIIEMPVESSFIASAEALSSMEQLGLTGQISGLGLAEEDVTGKKAAKALKDGKISLAGTLDKPDYNAIVHAQTDLAVLPAEILPEKVAKDASEEERKLSEEQTELVRKLQTRFSSLAIPVFVDRSDDEASAYAQAEWIKVYGAVFGQEEKAEQIFREYVKSHKNKKTKND